MAFNRLFHSVKKQFQELTDGLWQEEAVDRLQTKIDRLSWEQRRRYALLVRHRSVIDNLRQRLDRNEKRAGQLSCSIETHRRDSDWASAWRYAIELDHTRATIDEDRTQIELHERAYREHLEDVKYLKRRLTDLEEKLCLK